MEYTQINKIKNNILSSSTVTKFPKSPLRYPGGKARAVEIILSLIPNKIDTLVSPFIGGGSIEIAAAHIGIKVKGYDIFKPLVHFWQELLLNSICLANRVKQYYPLSKDNFYELQKMVFTDPLEDAAVFYVLNRSSFSGSTLSGGMSPGHPRFTKSSISYLQNFKSRNLSVEEGDFHNVLPLHQDDFMYLDPPYLIKCGLYGRNGNTHKEFDHFGLYKLLEKRGKWILSYNDCPEIRELYKHFRLIAPQWKYGMSSNKNSRELLILSDDIPNINNPSNVIQPPLF